MLDINLTFIFVVVSFIIFFFIIKAILFAPISKIIDEREEFYAQQANECKNLKEKTKTLMEEKDKAIKETRNKASGILKEISINTTNENEARINRIKKQAYVKVDENQQDLDNQKTEVKKEVKSDIEGIVKIMMSKVIGEDVEISLEEERINKYLNI